MFCQILLFGFLLAISIVTVSAAKREINLSIYPPPISNDYNYRIKIYCKQNSNSGAADEVPSSLQQQKLIAEHTLCGTKNSEQNVKEGQFFENDKQLNGKQTQLDTVAQNKFNFTISMPAKAEENLTQCANNELFIEIVKIFAVNQREEKLLKLERMTIEQFKRTDKLEYDFEEEYSKKFEIISHMEKQPFEFTLRISKASGINSQNFILQQDFVVYKKTLTSGTVNITVPITKERKISERRDGFQIKINYQFDNTDNENETKNFVKIYRINDEMWNNYSSFKIDFNRSDVSPLNTVESTNDNHTIQQRGNSNIQVNKKQISMAKSTVTQNSKAKVIVQGEQQRKKQGTRTVQ
ncbi:hypothetical protein niasHT_001353 [Heterodera trifolii]|uniref:Uncharacterized protein n=1 Tax=Heterodera trifolii TaxID=157864 RepID=A0ABD2LNB6_9BILA